MRTIFFAMSFILVAIASIAMVECASYARLRSEVEVQKENVEIARKGETEYKLNDSTKAVEIRALRLEKEQFDAILKEKDIQIDNLRKENRKKLPPTPIIIYHFLWYKTQKSDTQRVSLFVLVSSTIQKKSKHKKLL